MGAVSNISSARYIMPGSNYATPFKIHKVKLPETVTRRYPTYTAGMSTGQAALERVKKADLAASSAVYVYKQIAPG